ncbi:MAG: AAA family ATPase [Erysipelotrichaceae bacterium]
MVFLKEFTIPNEDQEYQLILDEKRTIFNNVYPLKIFPAKAIERFVFETPITVFYGENGSGKSTILNIISAKINAERKNKLETSDYFKRYVDICDCTINTEEVAEVKILTSDDVFDYILSVEAINSKVNEKRQKLVEEFISTKYSPSSDFYDEYDQLSNKIDANRLTMSGYVRKRLNTSNIIRQSNGETALSFWQKEIKENGLYFLDEPENSLSALNQNKLKEFIEESARFFNCQFIISTHSPFLLSMHNSRIYDLDSVKCQSKKWYELENMKVYYSFFKDHQAEFENK